MKEPTNNGLISQTPTTKYRHASGRARTIKSSLRWPHWTMIVLSAVGAFLRVAKSDSGAACGLGVEDFEHRVSRRFGKPVA